MVSPAGVAVEGHREDAHGSSGIDDSLWRSPKPLLPACSLPSKDDPRGGVLLSSTNESGSGGAHTPSEKAFRLEGPPAGMAGSSSCAGSERTVA